MKSFTYGIVALFLWATTALAQSSFLSDYANEDLFKGARLVHNGDRFPFVPTFVDKETEAFSIMVSGEEMRWDDILDFMGKKHDIHWPNKEYYTPGINLPVSLRIVHEQYQYFAWFFFEDGGNDVVFTIRKTDCNSGLLATKERITRDIAEQIILSDEGFALAFQLLSGNTAMKGFESFCEGFATRYSTGEEIRSGNAEFIKRTPTYTEEEGGG